MWYLEEEGTAFVDVDAADPDAADPVTYDEINYKLNFFELSTSLFSMCPTFTCSGDMQIKRGGLPLPAIFFTILGCFLNLTK